MRNFVPLYQVKMDGSKAILLLRAPALLALLLFVSCAPRYVMKSEVSGAEQDGRQAIVEYAKSLIGTSDLRAISKNFKNDCSGFINGVYAMQGRKIAYIKVRKDRSLSESLYLTLEDRNCAFTDRLPNIADAVFFRNTYQTPYNSVTHVGLVEKVGADGTVTILHYASGKVSRISMNLRHPGDRVNDEGGVINDYVRKDNGGTPRKDYLAGRLFCSYGDIYRYTERQR
jgi:hypothetical protein